MSAFDFNQFMKPWDKELAYADYPEAQYHATVAMSSGQLKRLMDSPAHFASGLINPQKRTSPALRFGSIVHKAVLEGEEFRRLYRVMPEFSGKGSKAAKAAWLEDHQGFLVLKSEEEEMEIAGMLASLMAHPVAKALIQGCEKRAEISGFFNHLGIRSKMRADIWRQDDVIVDLKTARDASERGFTKDAWDLFYPIQAAWYLKGAEQICKRPMKAFVFIAVEKTPPYPVGVYSASPFFLEAGERMLSIALKRFQRAIETGTWPAYGDQAKDLHLPPWGLRDLEEMERNEEALYALGN